MEKYMKEALLFDSYGALLSSRQQEVIRLYYEENLSLAEIGENFGVTRQAACDTLHSAEKALADYEEKLGLVARSGRTGEKIDSIAAALDRALQDAKREGSVPLIADIEELQAMFGSLREEE